MNRTFLASAVLIGLAMLVAPLARAQAPTVLPMQGYLTEDDGTVVDGDVELTLSLYGSDIIATPLYRETQMVMVDRGSFAAYLGEGDPGGGDPLDLALFRDNGEVWVGISIDGGVEMPRFQLGSVPYAAFAQYAGDAASLGGVPATDYALGADAQAPISGTCAAGSAISAIAADGSVTCEADDDTTYAAGSGLTLAGDTFSVDTGAIQARVSGTCAAGSAISSVAADGTVTCEADDDTTYAAGSGLTLAGDTFSVDTSAIQSRVGGTCPAGSSIRAISATGTVTCEADDVGTGDISGVTAGTGLSGGGASGSVTLAADTSYLQRRVSGSCPAGSSIRAISSTGTVTCETDDSGTGDITGVTAGTGLSGGGSSGGVTLNVDTGYVQRRVTGTCAAGSAIRAIAADGTVTCETDDTGGNIIMGSSGDSVTVPASGYGYAMSSSTVSPTASGTCRVVTTVQVNGVPTTSTSSSFIRTAWATNGGAPTNDGTYGLYIGAQANTTYSTPITMSHVYSVTAGNSYNFGCMVYSTGDFASRTAYCRTSWTCSF